MCIDRRCQYIEDLKFPKCYMGCSGNGVCNTRGNCHCDAGWAYPLCDRAGSGGSIDSGPAGDYGEYMKDLGIIQLLTLSLPSEILSMNNFEKNLKLSPNPATLVFIWKLSLCTFKWIPMWQGSNHYLAFYNYFLWAKSARAVRGLRTKVCFGHTIIKTKEFMHILDLIECCSLIWKIQSLVNLNDMKLTNTN